MNEQQLTYLDKAPPMYKSAIQGAFDGSRSRANAIKAKCLSCCNFDRIEVRNCAAVICPLHSFRPYQTDVEEIESKPD